MRKNFILFFKNKKIKLFFISLILFIIFAFSTISINPNMLPVVSKIYAVSNPNQEQLDQTASILSSIQSIINKLKTDIQTLFGREVKAQADITTGLVGYWKFDEGAGTTAGDSSGNNNTGTLTNGPTWITGKVGTGALSFDGVDDYINLGNVPALDLDTQHTISAWVYPEKMNAAIFTHARSLCCGTEYYLSVAQSFSIPKAGFGHFGSGELLGNTTLSLNTWIHIVGTWDGTQRKIYVNGVLDASGALSGTISELHNNTIIGALSATENLFQGKIDDLRVYNRALIQTEITELYNFGSGTPSLSDTIPPALSSGSPTGALPSGTTQTTLSLATNENAICKYGTVPNTAYGSIVPPAGGTFATTGGIAHSQNFIGLTNGTSYNYYVRCQDTAGNTNTTDYTISFSVSSPVVSDTQAPTIPTGLIATAISSSQINLSWTASGDNVGVAGYKIYRCAGSACAPTTQIATSAVNSYSNTSLTVSTAYTYAVSAYDAAGNESGKSTSISATTQQVSALSPVVINGKRFYSGGKPYFPSTHFLMRPISSHVYFSHLISDADRQVMRNDIKANGYNSIYLYTLNQGDYGGKSVTPYLDENALVGGAFNENKIQQWRIWLEGMINDGIRPIIWLFADDSIKISSASPVELKRYIQKMVSSFDDLPIMWVLGLEVDEYWSKAQSDELGVYLQSIANNPVGIHQSSGLTDYMASLWVDFGVYQYGFSGTWVEIYNNALSKNIAIGNKPLIFAEYHVGQDTQAVSEGLGAAFAGVAGVGNGAPGGLDEFMEKLPDNMTPSRAGNLLNLTVANTVAEADMSTLNFYIKSQDLSSPSTPTNPTATAISSSQINLSWTASTDNMGVTGYKIYRCSGSGCAPTVQIATSAANSYPNTGLTAFTAYTYAVSAYDAAGNESGKSGSASGMTQAPPTSTNPIDNLKPGEWYEVPNSKLRGAAPCDGRHGSNINGCGSKPNDPAESCYDSYAIYDFSHIMDGWNGGAFDSKRDRLLIWGGGHKGWAGNDIYGFDMNILKWERIKDASCLQASDFGSPELEISGYYPSDGSPRMRHTYNYIQYVPAIDRFCSFGGAGMSTSGQTNTARVDCFNFNTKQWEKMADTGSWGIGAFSAVDPVTGHAFARGNVCSACANLWEFDPIKNTWTLRTNGESNRNMYYVTAAIDPVRRKFVAIGSGLSYVWDIGTSGIITRQTLTTTGTTEIIGANNPGFEYDPVSDKFVAWNGGADLYTLDMDTLVWTKVSPAPTNSVTPTARNVNGTYGRFRYSPSKNAFIVVNNTDQNVYIYKLNTGGGTHAPTDTQPPSIPFNLAATVISSSQINISWTASTDNVAVTGYKIYRCAGSACAPTVQIATSVTNSYSNTGLTASTAYTYAVSAYDGAGNESGKSGSASGIMQAPVINKFNIGDFIETTANLNVRNTPSATGALLGTQILGSKGTIIGGPTIADGFTWWQIDYDTGADGWSAEDWLIKIIIIDTSAPISSNGSPNSILSFSTTQTALSLSTNEGAACKYGITPNINYASIANTFTTTGGTSHSKIITGLTNGTSYNYYVRCQDIAGNANLDDYIISFSVSSQAPIGLSIPITVEEPLGIARTNEPITSGIPLPQGTQTTNWSLWDGNTEIPLQTTKLQGRTPWILLDFQTSVLANTKKTLTLKDTAATAFSSKPINIIEDLSQITVDNKIIKTKLSKTNFNLFEEVWLDKDNDGTYSQAEQIIIPQQDNIQIVDSTTGTTFSGKGVPTKIVWEYQGSLRSTLRVDGRFKNTSNQEFINYTTKITFYAGRSDVKIEHVLRNSYQPNERHVKIKSATLKLGTGVIPVKAARPGSVSWTNVSSDGTVFELVPAMLWNIDTAVNNGMVIPDWSYHGASLVADFSAALSAADQANMPNTVKTPLFAMASPSWYSEHAELTTSKFSTLDDEKQAYQKWGWTWTPYPGPYGDTGIYTDDQEPQDPLAKGPGRAIPDYFVSSQIIVVHGDTESDDLWQHNLMYLRTGQRSYLDRAMAWARYMKWENAFRTDSFDYAWDGGWENSTQLVSRPVISIPLTATDSSYLSSINKGRVDIRDWGADHLWGWGLLDYYYLTGDIDAIEAAKDIGEASKRVYGWKIPGSYSPPGGSTRGPARNFLLATRLYEVTQEQKWQDYMEHMAKIWLQSSTWDPRGMYDSSDVRPIHIGFLSHALYRYYQVTGNTIARDRIIAIANWVKQYGLQSAYLYSGNYIKMDSPNPGDVWHTSLDDGNFAQFSPIHTNTFIDTLVRGYRLTGDASFLERAKLHWDRASKGRGGDPNFRTVGDNQVGRFMNNWFLKDGGLRRYYSENKGEITYGHLLFYDYVKAGITPDITLPIIPTTLTATAISPSQINLSWTASTDNVGVTGYKIYRCSGSACAPTVQIATSAINSYSNTGLTASTAYTYAVSAYDAAGNNSAKSSSVSATTQSPIPQCSDTIDNDNDGKIDFGGANPDPDCSSLTDNNESDTIPPAISSVISTTLASTTARIDWTTNEPSTSQVDYGFTAQYGTASTLSATLSTSHSVLLSNLSPDNTTYNYRVRSKDSSGNESISTNNSFITPGLTDVIPPASTTNLTANNITQTSVDLVTWTAAGDDGNQGTASSFDIRYATGELTETTWNNGGVVRATGEPTPKIAGSIMNYTLVGLTPNTTYKVALKTLDEVSNQSLISNIITFTTLKAEVAPTPTPTPTPTPAPSPGGGGGSTSSGGGGGGGGGSSSGGGGGSPSTISDTTPAPKITELKAQGADQQVRLTWKNPESSDWVRTIVVRSLKTFATSSPSVASLSPSVAAGEGGAKEGTKDGSVVFEGTEHEFTDINLKNNQNYYYSLFTIDRTPNYSQPANIMVKTIADKVSLEEIKPAQITVREQEVLNLAGEAAEITKSDIKSFLSKFNFKRDQAKEDISLKQYIKELIKGLTDLMADRQIALNHFIAYGTATTLKLGAGERAGVVNSYKSAFNKLPETAEEWTDAIKIANGRWPSQTSPSAETKASQEFKKVYKRAPNLKQANDNAAVTVISYGLRPANRNLNSEKAALKSFRAIYGYAPKSAVDWDIVRAVAYSGAKR